MGSSQQQMLEVLVILSLVAYTHQIAQFINHGDLIDKFKGAICNNLRVFSVF